ncbi:MAG: sn-glycerol-3-phosphate ABC transporter ATP-binding protein UgpC [Pseudomonadota bacterium]
MSNLTLTQLVKTYGQTEVLHSIDLEIEDGEFVVLVGPSGCGKSTTLRLIAGLEEATSGTIEIGGKVVNNLEPKERNIAMVFQNYAIYPHMSVRKNIGFGLRSSKMAKADKEKRIDEIAEILGMTDLLSRKPNQLSGGQRQRVAIGRAIVRDPQVFLFDEPLSNLDAALRVQTRLEIAKLHRRMDATMIYVTHDQVEAMTLADRIVVLNAGNVEQFGSPLELYHRPQNLFVATFIGSPTMNIVAGTLAGASNGDAEVKVANGSVLHAKVDASNMSGGTDVKVGMRPEHLSLCAVDDGETFRGSIDVIEELGESFLAHVDVGEGERIIVRGDGTARVKEGETVGIRFRPEDGHVFSASGAALPRTSPDAFPESGAPTLN